MLPRRRSVLREELRREVEALRDDELLDVALELLLRGAADERREGVALLVERCGVGLARRTGSGRRATGLLTELLLERLACRG